MNNHIGMLLLKATLPLFYVIPVSDTLHWPRLRTSMDGAKGTNDHTNNDHMVRLGCLFFAHHVRCNISKNETFLHSTFIVPVLLPTALHFVLTLETIWAKYTNTSAWLKWGYSSAAILLVNIITRQTYMNNSMRLQKVWLRGTTQVTLILLEACLW